VPALFSILLGGVFTIASAYAWGVLTLRRLTAPWEIELAVGAAVESLLVFVVLACGAGGWPVYLAVGAAPLAALIWARRSRALATRGGGMFAVGCSSVFLALPFLA
jgi:uncharacterized protein (TIGR03382 family)